MKSLYIIGAALLFAVIMANMACAADFSASAGIVKVSLVNQNPDPASAGGVVELKFMVENTGGADAGNVILELLPSYPFSKLPDEEYMRNISVLRGSQGGSDAVIIRYRVMVNKDASAGNSKISIRYSTAGFDSYVTEDFDVGITSREFAQIVIDKSRISPGKETNLTFTINNMGNSPIRNLVFSWSETGGSILPVFSDDTKYVKYIDVGGSIDLEYKVVADVNANPGLYLLNLNLKFDTENGTSREIETKAGMFVGGETDFDVSYSESSSGQTSLSIANIGNNPAYSVTVRIPEQDGFTVSGSASSIVGNLDKGDYTIVSFQVTSLLSSGSRNMTDQYAQGRRAGSPGNITGMQQRNTTSLKVMVDYTDTIGERHAVEKSVALQSQTNASSFQAGFRRQTDNTSYIIIAVVAAATLGGGGYYLYRRRMKKAKKTIHKEA
jgi:hypothetical protein